MEGVQPFDNLSPEQYDDLKRDIQSKGRRLDQMKVHLSANDILYDGHQRLRILLYLGRKTIGEDEITRNDKIKTRHAALMEAIKIQRNRRNLVGKGMAKVMWDLVIDKGMTQSKIAKEIGMRQQSVCELMNKHRPPDLPDTITVTGDDGKVYHRRGKPLAITSGKPLPATVARRDEEPRETSRYERRQRVKNRLTEARRALAHAVADASVCVDFDGYERGILTEDVEAIRKQLDAIMAILASQR
jgi:hypothetical protein